MNHELLQKGMVAFGGPITKLQLAQFSAYSALLKEWNAKMNLTAIVDDDGIAVKHFLDSILPLYHVELAENSSLMDVGTGAGFPGIPIKIMRADLRLTLVDSLQKRVGFLDEVCSRLELKNVETVHGRAEELGKDRQYRERFDTVTSRAVANLKVLGEYCLPLVRRNGIFLALKAEEMEAELESAKAMLGNLGGTVEAVISAPLPESDMVRKLVLVRKERSTPAQFPRRTNRIKK